MSQHTRFGYILLFVQKPTLNIHSELSSEARNINFGLSFHLYPYYEYARR